MPTRRCPGCGVRLPVVDGPTHPYMTSSAACWRAYTDLLAVQYADPERMSFQQLVVDAYAVQHPGGGDRRAVQSVGIHLMTLCLFLEFGTDPSQGARLHRLMVERPAFDHLVPPAEPGRLTVLDVPRSGEIGTARAAAYAWATEVWTVWRAHHDTIRDWLRDARLLPARHTLADAAQAGDVSALPPTGGSSEPQARRLR